MSVATSCCSKAARTKVTPVQLAREWGIAPHKILRWIHSGELRAFNAASDRSGKPRFLIDRADVAAFEASRSAEPPVAPARRRRRDADVTEYV